MTTDREPNDTDWLRRAIKNIFIPGAILPKPSLCDETVGLRSVCQGQLTQLTDLGTGSCNPNF